MDISFTEGNNFKIKGKSISLTTSPFAIGDKVIYGPGEYEVGGVSVMGWRTKDKIIIFLIEVDGLSVLYLGDFSGKLESGLLDVIGEVDVVLTSSKDGISDGLRFDPYYIISTNSTNFSDLGMQSESMQKFSLKKDEIVEEMSIKAIVLTRK